MLLVSGCYDGWLPVLDVLVCPMALATPLTGPLSILEVA